MKKASLYKLAIACMNFDILDMHYTMHTYQWSSAVSMHYTVMETPCVLTTGNVKDMPYDVHTGNCTL